MGATSVTGVGQGSADPKNSQHMCLPVSHLIGPRWNEEKEKEFNSMKRLLRLLLVISIFSNILFGLFTFTLLIAFFATR